MESKANKTAAVESVSLCAELHRVLRLLWSGKWAVVTPHSLVFAVWKFMPYFRSYRQQVRARHARVAPSTPPAADPVFACTPPSPQDAHEFFSALIDGLDMELVTGGSPEASPKWGDVVSDHAPIRLPPSGAHSLEAPSPLGDRRGWAQRRRSSESSSPRGLLGGARRPASGSPRGLLGGARTSKAASTPRPPPKRAPKRKQDAAAKPVKKRKASPAKRKASPAKRKASPAKRKAAAAKRKPSPAKSSRAAAKRKGPPAKRRASPAKRRPRKPQPKPPVALACFRPSTFLRDTMRGRLTTIVSCSRCHNVSSRDEHFWALSVDIVMNPGSQAAAPPPPPSGTTRSARSSTKAARFIEQPAGGRGGTGVVCSLADCFTRLTAKEVLDGDSAYHCDVCGDKGRAEKCSVVGRAPDILVIHVIRATWWKQGSREKRQQRVSFPLTGLDLSPWSDGAVSPNAAPYRLAAVVTHHGRGIDTGHYTAFCRPRGGAEEDWLKFDDEKVRVATAEQVAAAQAYLLFYERL